MCILVIPSTNYLLGRYIHYLRGVGLLGTVRLVPVESVGLALPVVLGGLATFGIAGRLGRSLPFRFSTSEVSLLVIACRTLPGTIVAY